MKRRNHVLVAVAAAAGFTAGYAARDLQEAGNPASKAGIEINARQAYAISRVVDGDTVRIDGGIEVLLSDIRLLGIDTRERGEPLYAEAKEKLEEWVAGKDVLLERDRRNTDRYGRLLRYIIVDGRNLNIEMVRIGYAKAFMHEGLKYERELQEAEQEARQNSRGIWAE